MIIGAILSIALVLVVIYVPNLSYGSLMVLFFVLGLITSSQVISYPLVAESNPVSVTATASAVASILIMGGGFLQPVFGWLMQLGWDNKMVNGVPFYSAQDYKVAMLTLPITFVIALIAAFFIKETNCKPLSNNESDS